jgi:tRNA threonylcarbamoyladenosine biosynthesis protein TsaE
MKKSYFIKLADSKALARKIAPRLHGGEILALIGPLGSGKTTFTKELAGRLKVKTKVTSPTFTLMHRFPAKVGKTKIFLYHLDLYRTKNFKEVKTLGLEEFWAKPATVTVIEWADKIKKHWPKKTIAIYFSHE